MMKTTIIKKATALLALLATFSTLSFTTNAYAMESSLVEDMVTVYSAIQAPDSMDQGIFSDDDVWYDTYIEAYNHHKFRIGEHVEFKNHYVIFYGWTTKGCTVTDIAVAYEKGKYAPIYKNSYNNNYYLGSAYE